MTTSLVWFRDDLRLCDHPAAAAAPGWAVAVTVLDAGRRGLGAAARWWLSRAISALDHDLGGRLVVLTGEPETVLPDFARACSAREVHVIAGRTPAERLADARVAAALAARGGALVRHPGGLLHDPLRLRDGRPYRVFAPFWRALSAAASPPPAPAPRTAWAAAPVAGLSPGDSGLLPPGAERWTEKLSRVWTPGEAAARAALEDFVSRNLAAYARDRDRPGLAATSRLSPALRWGHLSPGQVWRRVNAAIALEPGLEAGGAAFLRQLAWREFAHHVLAFFPDLARLPLDPAFAAFPWRDDPGAFRAWCRGETGCPLVDAAMRELWQTGWMHNRGRMVAASFLVKDLLIDWRRGLAWFEDTLVDADPAADPFGWQWVAGSGADAAPWIRIFNPRLQADRFDPDGAYVRAWAVSERPPLVDHAAARSRALAVFRSRRRS